MTVVVGTAGHIDHGKTALLHALTGIDADRLPEERRRGMTIDVGFAHLDLEDGSSIDFVDVPGHDRLVANMLVGAGEIDAALLVVAMDEGPRPQTVEHLELLDALGIGDGLVVLTKADRVPPEDPLRGRRVDEVHALVAPTTLRAAPILLASSVSGEGLDGLRAALLGLRDRVLARGDDRGSGGARLAVDRAFAVAGRGTVVTGTLRGGALSPGMTVRILPGAGEARVREVQVHGQRVSEAHAGRTAVNLAGIELDEVGRGSILTTDPTFDVTQRLLVALRLDPAAADGSRRKKMGAPPTKQADEPAAGAPGGSPRLAQVPTGDLRLHLGTAEAGVVVGRGRRTRVPLPDGRVVAELRAGDPVATRRADRFVIRRPSPGALVAGGVILDPRPPTGPARRRITSERLARLALAGPGPESAAALLDLHGALPVPRWAAAGGSGGAVAGSLVMARDVLDSLASEARRLVEAHHQLEPASAGIPLAALRTAVAMDLRRRVTAAPPDASSAASAIVDGLVAAGRLARDGDTIRDPARTASVPPDLAAAMDRLEAALAVPAPPSFDEAVAASRCPREGIHRLEVEGRIIRLDPQLAYAATAYGTLARHALELARSGPLSPAALRDATGTSRRYVLAILEDLDRRGVLTRTPDGHVPGPRADVPDAIP